MEFDYIGEDPIIPIKLEQEGKSLCLEFFVDSGADMTIIPLGFATELGFDKWNDDELMPAQGIEGGAILFFIREINILIGDQKLRIPIACALKDDIPLIAGRKGIFDKFIVCFDNLNRKIRLIERD